MNHLVDTGFINGIREIWWDVRPHNNFGTVEVRICDLPSSVEDVLGLTAMVQCLVQYLSEEIDGGTYQYNCHPTMVRQNKWRACRHGMDAKLVELETQRAIPAREMVHKLVERLRPTARALGCEGYLEHAGAMADGKTGSQRQIQVFKETGDATEIVRRAVIAGAPAGDAAGD